MVKRFINAKEELKFWKDIYGRVAVAEKGTLEAILALVNYTEEDAISILKYGKDEESTYAKQFLRYLDKLKERLTKEYAEEKYKSICEILKTEGTDKSNFAKWFTKYGKKESETDMQILNELREGIGFAEIISEDKSRKGE